MWMLELHRRWRSLPKCVLGETGIWDGQTVWRNKAAGPAVTGFAYRQGSVSGTMFCYVLAFFTFSFCSTGQFLQSYSRLGWLIQKRTFRNCWRRTFCRPDAISIEAIWVMRNVCSKLLCFYVIVEFVSILKIHSGWPLTWGIHSLKEGEGERISFRPHLHSLKRATSETQAATWAHQPSPKIIVTKLLKLLK